MTTRKDMKQKLKASAKRRARRVAAADRKQQEHQGPENTGKKSERESVDVGHAIAVTILEFVQQSGVKARDAMVLTALRSCYQGTLPSEEESRQLSERLAKLPSRIGVGLPAFRREIDQMIDLAKGQRDSGHVNPFLQLLQLLAR